MNKSYLIKIKFTDYFFFGQGVEGRGTLGNSANYYLNSNLFPQQTGVRGFLRYLLLQLNTCLYPSGGPLNNEVKGKIARLIGENSIEIDADIGIINHFSPLFVFCNDKPIFYRPNEFIEKCSILHNPILLKQNKGKVYPFLQKNIDEVCPAYYLDGYNAKIGFADGFTDSQGQFIPSNSIYKKHLISGNRINKDGSPDDESFYKQEFILLNEPYSFGVWVEFETENGIDFVLPKIESMLFSVMGKEQKEVAVYFTEQSCPDFSRYFPDFSLKGEKILLLSDTCVDLGFEKHCIFASNQISPFRYIHSSVYKTDNYARLNNTRRSKGQFLIQRGSVLYLKQNETVFLDHSDYKKIGYNYYIRLKN